MGTLDDKMKDIEKRLHDKQKALEQKYEQKVADSAERLMSSATKPLEQKDPQRFFPETAPPNRPPSQSSSRSSWKTALLKDSGSKTRFLKAWKAASLTSYGAATLDQEPEEWLDTVTDDEEEDFETADDSFPEVLVREHEEQAELLLRILSISPGEVASVGGLAFHSGVVRDNPAYAKCADSASLLFCGLGMVNAFATDDPVETPEGRVVQPPVIVVTEGICLAMRLAALCLASSEKAGKSVFNSSVRSLLPKVAERVACNPMDFDLRAAVQVCQDLGLHIGLTPIIESRTRSIAAGTLLTVIAHELGHVCLNHTLGEGQDDQVSRIWERQADLFASAVVATTPFTDYSVIGGVLFNLLMAWVEPALSRETGTHPNALNRLMDFIRDHEEQASSVGVTPETIVACLPPALQGQFQKAPD